MKVRIPIKYRGFPGPFAHYRPVAAQPNNIFLGALLLFWIGCFAFSFFLFSNTIVTTPFLIVGWLTLAYCWRTRWTRRARPHDWLLCLQCAYPLDELPSESRCPECGNLYTHASTRWGWRVMTGNWSSDMDPPPPLPQRD
ncbi:MAG: hypothetical protein P8L37_02960 [Phycisphaerales bacterium]|nr:hypothetical protein [Phycisphaerales bacterium]